ncbi:MAG: RNA pyrophosphohydrolase [Alphaproteobacteria bacterium]|nr:RNA pyrophosphohydrolase [Alphaproteobacteria bacterium]
MRRPVDPETLPYRPCVGVMVFDRQGRVFVGRRISGDLDEAWQMPQGGIDAGEDLRAAALRELEEETGISKVEILAEASDWFAYDLPREAVGIALKGKFRGQRQKWFAMRFSGAESDINLKAHRPPEFDAYRWVAIDEVMDLIVPFKREVYGRVVAAFRHLAKPYE